MVLFFLEGILEVTEGLILLVGHAFIVRFQRCALAKVPDSPYRLAFTEACFGFPRGAQLPVYLPLHEVLFGTFEPPRFQNLCDLVRFLAVDGVFAVGAILGCLRVAGDIKIGGFYGGGAAATAAATAAASAAAATATAAATAATAAASGGGAAATAAASGGSAAAGAAATAAAATAATAGAAAASTVR